MRGLIRTVGVVAVLCLMAGAAAADDYFPQSVASGDPTSNSVILWTRAVGTDGAVPESVKVVVATDEAFTNIVVKRWMDVDDEYDGIEDVLARFLPLFDPPVRDAETSRPTGTRSERNCASPQSAGSPAKSSIQPSRRHTSSRFTAWTKAPWTVGYHVL